MQDILPSHATQFIMKLQKALLLELRFNKEFRVGRPLRASSHEHRWHKNFRWRNILLRIGFIINNLNWFRSLSLDCFLRCNKIKITNDREPWSKRDFSREIPTKRNSLIAQNSICENCFRENCNRRHGQLGKLFSFKRRNSFCNFLHRVGSLGLFELELRMVRSGINWRRVEGVFHFPLPQALKCLCFISLFSQFILRIVSRFFLLLLLLSAPTAPSTSRVQ